MANKRQTLLYLAASGAQTYLVAGAAIGIGTAAPATLNRRVALSGSAVGIGSASGSVKLNAKLLTPVAGQIGVGLSSGALTKRRTITSGTATGVGLTTGAILAFKTQTGATRGIGTAAGRMSIAIRGGAVVGVGIGGGTQPILRKQNMVFPVPGAKSGVGISAGTIVRRARLSGAVAGIGTAAAGRISIALRGAAVGIGKSSGRLVPTLRGTGTGIGTVVTGAIQLQRGKLSAATQPTGIGTPTGTLNRRVTLAASTIGIGKTAGALVVTRSLTGTSLGVGIPRNNAIFRYHLIATPTAPSAVGVGIGSGATALSAGRRIAGALSIGIGKSTGTLGKRVRLAGSSTGIGTPTATLKISRGLYGAGIGIGKSTNSNIMSFKRLFGPATGIGKTTITGLVKRYALVPLVVPNGIGTSVGVIGVNGVAVSWVPAFDANPTLVGAQYFQQFDPAWWHPATVHTYTALLRIISGSSIKSRLYNVTDSVAVAGSEVTVSGTMAMTEVESGAMTFAADIGVKDYRAEVGSISGSMGTIYRARIAHQGS